MQRFYFTFGSWEKYPYKDTYLVVIAESYKDAVDAYREKFPDIQTNVVNCAFIYTEDEWKDGKCLHYQKIVPAEIILSEEAKKERCQNLLIKALRMIDEKTQCGITCIAYLLGSSEEELVGLGIDVKEVFG